MVEIDDDFKKSMLKPDEKLLNFDGHGITEDYLLNKLKEELEAKETKFFHRKGKVVETEDVIEWNTRQNARKDAHKLRGDYPTEKVDHTITLEDKLRAIHEKRDKEE